VYGTDPDELLNVFYYKQITPGGTDEGAEHLAGVFESEIGVVIRVMQAQVVQWLSVNVENIVPGPDFFVQPYTSVFGDQAGDALPPTNCWSFRLNRASSASRNGQKRFAGVTEASQVNGFPTSGQTTILNAVAAVLDDVIGGPAPANATYQPIIFRAGRDSVTIPEKIIPAVVQADFDIASAQFVSIGTQNSRKF